MVEPRHVSKLPLLRYPRWGASKVTEFFSTLSGTSTVSLDPSLAFAAFVSYRHHKSREFAENLELAIKAYAKPIWQRPMPIFRDEKYLVPGRPLDDLIRSALVRSQHLIYIASSEAAASEWVADELRIWCVELGRREKLIIVLSDGTIAYDATTKILDWKRTDCLPPVLGGVVEKVPLFIDGRGFTQPATQTLDNAEFRRAINQIVASLRGIDPIELSGQEVVQHRRNLRIRNALLSATVVSGIAFGIAAVMAEMNRRDAVAQTQQVERRESELLASASRIEREKGDYKLALQQAVDGLPKDLSAPERPLVPEVAGALIEAVNANRLANVIGNGKNWSRVAAISSDNKLFAYGTDDGDVVLWRREPQPRVVVSFKLKSWITGLSFAPDGRNILATSLDGDIAIFEPNSAPISPLKTGLSINTAAFSRDGRLYAIGTRDGVVQVRDAATSNVVSQTPFKTDMIDAVIFTPDAKQLVTAGHDGKAHLWDVASGSEVRQFRHSDSGWIVAADLNRSGTILVTASLDEKNAKLWSLSDGALLATMDHTLAVNDAKFETSGRRVVTASRDRTAKVWSVPDGRLVATLAHSQDVDVADFLPDGEHVVTGSDDGVVRLWLVADSKEVAILGRHKERDLVSTLVPTTDRNFVLSTSSSGEVRLWRTQSENPSWTLGHDDPVESVAFGPDGTLLLSSAEDYTCRVWNVASGKALTVIGMGEVVQSWCKWYRDGASVLFSPFDKAGSLQVHVVPDGRELRAFSGQGAPVISVAFDPASEAVVTATTNRVVWLWPHGPGGQKVELGTLPDDVYSLLVDADRHRVIAGAGDGTIAVWEMSSPYSRHDIPWQRQPLGRLALSRDNLHLAILTKDGAVQLLNMDNMERIDGPSVGEVWSSPIAFSPDGTKLAIAGKDGLLWLWPIISKPIAIQGHSDDIRAIAFDPNGTRIATASSDGTVRLWSSLDGQAIAVLRGHNGRSTSVDFSSDSQWLASSADDGSIRVWRISKTLAELRDLAIGLIAR